MCLKAKTTIDRLHSRERRTRGTELEPNLLTGRRSAAGAMHRRGAASVDIRQAKGTKKGAR